MVEIAGTRVHLTAKEYQMLELLALRKGMTLTKEMFLNHLYGGMDEPGMKIIDVFMCKLRKKLVSASGGKDYIETVWGRGYVLREPAENVASVPARQFLRVGRCFDAADLLLATGFFIFKTRPTPNQPEEIVRRDKKKARKKFRAFVISIKGGLNNPCRPCHPYRHRHCHRPTVLLRPFGDHGFCGDE